MTSPFPVVLGSRSPRRRELLQLLFPATEIQVSPPQNPEELEFSDCQSLAAIQQRLLQIASDKAVQVQAQWVGPYRAILCADTTIVASWETSDSLTVLGQPPEQGWQDVVTSWFEQHYFGKTHLALTGVVILTPDRTVSFVIESQIRMIPRDPTLLAWYLGTGESLGKAGGYALQGAGSVFVDAVTGSLTNVVGLPLRETRAAFVELGIL